MTVRDGRNRRHSPRLAATGARGAQEEHGLALEASRR